MRFRPNAARLDSFSDGVMAIAITILVLDFKVPAQKVITEGALTQALLAQWPSLVGYVMSFIVVGTFWSHHSDMLSYIKNRDHVIRLLNVLFLMFISLFPFAAKVLAEYINTASVNTACSFYVGIFTLCTTAYHAVWLYAIKHPETLEDNINHSQLSEINRDYLGGLLFSYIAFGISLFNGLLALTFIMLVTLYFTLRVPEKRQERKAKS
jgi:uncharacterized membrane protein